jgi:hypothetical protein
VQPDESDGVGGAAGRVAGGQTACELAAAHFDTGKVRVRVGPLYDEKQPPLRCSVLLRFVAAESTDNLSTGVIPFQIANELPETFA